MGGSDLLLLVFDVADIQHKTHDAPSRAAPQHLALNPIPLGGLRALRLMHPREQQQILAMFQQFIKATTEFIPISRMKQRQPCLAGQHLLFGCRRQACGQLRSQLQQLAGCRPLPPARAQ